MGKATDKNPLLEQMKLISKMHAEGGENRKIAESLAKAMISDMENIGAPKSVTDAAMRLMTNND